jgi:hypothetical protein
MPQAPDPVIPLGRYFTGRPLSAEQRAQWEREAEARRRAIREGALLMIGRDANGQPFPAADEPEEQRLATADLRGTLRQAQAVRHELALQLVERKDVTARAEAHLDRGGHGGTSRSRGPRRGGRARSGRSARRQLPGIRNL